MSVVDFLEQKTFEQHIGKILSLALCMPILNILSLFVELSNIGYEGGEVTFKCTYAQGFQTKEKYFFKKDQSSDYLVETKNGQTSDVKGRASLEDFTNSRVFTVTLQNLTASDSGRYSCGMKKGGGNADHLSERRLHVKDGKFQMALHNITGSALCSHSTMFPHILGLDLGLELTLRNVGT